MLIITRIFKWWSRKDSPLCRKVKQRYMECLRECFVPPASYILCREACIKGVAEEYGLSIKKVEKCLNK